MCSNGPYGELLAMSRRLADLPPMPTAILAHHSVPYGSAFRQWDTRGRLFVWANRGQIADLPRREAAAGSALATPFGLLGIPVRYVP